MSTTSEYLNRKLFNMWLEKQYPHYTTILGLISILLILLFIFSIVSIFFLDSWYKLLILDIGLTMVFAVCVRIFLNYADIKYKSRNHKK